MTLRREIVRVLEREGRALHYLELAALSGRPRNSTKSACVSMMQDGLLERVGTVDGARWQRRALYLPTPAGLALLALPEHQSAPRVRRRKPGEPIEAFGRGACLLQEVWRP